MTKTLYACAVGLCLLFTTNFLQAQCDVVQSHVTTTSGLGYIEIDSTDSQIIDVMTNSTANAEYIYALTGSDFNIIRFLTGSSDDISDLDAGKYFIWGFSYTGNINLVPGDLVFTGSFSTGCWKISLTAVVIQKLNDGTGTGDPCASVNGGTVALATGGTTTTILIDGVPDSISFTSTVTPGGGISFTYIVTDANGNILGIPPGNTVDFDPAGIGTCFVYGLAYTGNLLAQMGENINGLQFSDACFDLSSNSLTINRVEDPLATVGQFFVSSNTQALVAVYNILMNGTVEMDTFTSVAGDADGIYYHEETDVLYQLNRTDNVLNAYSDVNTSLAASLEPAVTATSTADFINGREIAVRGDRLVVVQDASPANGDQNGFFIYDISPTAITFVKSYDADVNLWGIHADGSRLFAVVDNSNRLAIYENFFSHPAGPVSATSVVEVDGLFRTHGLTYDAATDMMILTDIGDAANAADGAFIVIADFAAASADGFINASEQVRVEGPLSMLGNPVDIAWDADHNMIYVAERANGGGRVMGFEMPTVSGDVAPVYDNLFAGASAIHLPGEEGMLANVAEVFFSSNTSGMVGVVSVLENNLMQLSSFASQGTDADGIYYDRDSDRLYQYNRSANVVDILGDVAMSIAAGTDPLLLASSDPDAVNGREIAVSNERLVVAQDASPGNGDLNQFFVYDISGGITLSKVFDASINLWGIHADGETLYAVEDNSNRLAIYDDFFNQAAGAIAPTSMVEIEGLVRTHGITYDADADMMFLTDIGDAATADDGAFIVIPDFATASADGIVTQAEQLRVEGAMTFLGNPVDIAWDVQRKLIYIAERANSGGRILAFYMPTESGNLAPAYNEIFAGASAVYLNDSDGIFFQDDDDEQQFLAGPTGFGRAQATATVYPNPTADYLNLQWEQDSAEDGETATVRIIDNNGRLLLQRDVALWEGTVTVGLIVSELKGGLYHVLVETQDGMLHQPFMKD